MVDLARDLALICPSTEAEDLSVARTNLGARFVVVDRSTVVGSGAFRIVYEGTFVGGNRNGQECVCKRFKSRYAGLAIEYFRSDFEIIDRALSIIESWNEHCEYGLEILMTRGSITNHHHGHKYLVEPLIRNFKKYTSNNGYIANEGWKGEVMEAFCHYSYHKSGGSLIVCDLQGRYRKFNRRGRWRKRFELTDPAICSRQRRYGPTGRCAC